MAKFVVLVEQYVQEVGKVVIEASSSEEAMAAYDRDPLEYDVDWEDGDNVIDRLAYATEDED
jgi:hypothetical protein